MLIDEANKLYIFLAERLLCDIVNENVSKQPILPTAALPAAAALPSEEGGLNDDKQEVLDEEEYQTDEQSEQYKLLMIMHIANTLKTMRIKLIGSPMTIKKILQISEDNYFGHLGFLKVENPYSICHSHRFL
jgi:hypothetical protein